METYPVDIDPGQLVHWLKAGCDISPSTFRITAKRASVPQDIPLRRETHLGDVEREDLSEIETIATLDIAPAHAGDGWTLSIVVEDEVGPRLLSEAPGGENEQTIDLGTFAKDFIRSGRGVASVTAEVQDAAAKAHLTKLIRAIETNRHVASVGGKKDV
jgi:hypothetical protein